MRRADARRAQTVTEYIVIVALCAVGLLVVVTVLGNDIRELVFTSSASLRGGAAQDIAFESTLDDTHHLGALSGTAQTGGQGSGSRGSGAGDSGGSAEEETSTPYRWNTAAQRWYDPESKLFVSFAEAGKYVEDPYMYTSGG